MRSISIIHLLLYSLMPAQMAGQTLSFFRPAAGIDSATAVATNASGIYVAARRLGQVRFGRQRGVDTGRHWGTGRRGGRDWGVHDRGGDPAQVQRQRQPNVDPHLAAGIHYFRCGGGYQWRLCCRKGRIPALSHQVQQRRQPIMDYPMGRSESGRFAVRGHGFDGSVCTQLRQCRQRRRSPGAQVGFARQRTVAARVRNRLSDSILRRGALGFLCGRRDRLRLCQYVPEPLRRQRQRIVEPSARHANAHRVGGGRDGCLHNRVHEFFPISIFWGAGFARAMQVRFRRRLFRAQIRSQWR